MYNNKKKNFCLPFNIQMFDFLASWFNRVGGKPTSELQNRLRVRNDSRYEREQRKNVVIPEVSLKLFSAHLNYLNIICHI